MRNKSIILAVAISLVCLSFFVIKGPTAEAKDLKIGEAGDNAIITSNLCFNNNTNCKTSWSDIISGSSNWTVSGSNIYNKNSGNVGIGTANSPGAKLEVNGDIKTYDSYGSYIGYRSFGSNFLMDGTGIFRTVGTHASYGYSGMLANWGTLGFFTLDGVTTTANAVITPTARMVILGNGYVGIGIVGPTSNLNVYSGTTNGSGNPLIRFSKGAAPLANVQYDTMVIEANDVATLRIGESDGTTAAITSGDSFTTFSSTHPIRFFTSGVASGLGYSGMGGTQRMVIDNAGYVGINKTDPGSSLDVNGLIKMRTSTITAAEDVIRKDYLDSALGSALGNYWPKQGGWKPASLSGATRLIGVTSPDGGEFALAYSGGQVHPYADGFFYQNEGQYRVLDTSNAAGLSVLHAETAETATDATKVAKAGDHMSGNLYFDNYGLGAIGTYSPNIYQAVFAMGDSYKLPADGSTTGSLYGLAWSHPNAGGVAGNLNSHGLLVMENGTFLAAISGSIRARDDMRAPIFYDSNDTGYYVDPNGSSNFNRLYRQSSTIVEGTDVINKSYLDAYAFPNSMVYPGAGIANSTGSAWGGSYSTTGSGNVVLSSSPTVGDIYNSGWFRNNSARLGLYNQETGAHFYSPGNYGWTLTGGGTYPQLIFRDTYESTIRGFVYSDVSGFGLLNSNGGWGFRLDPGSTEVFMPGSVGIGTETPLSTLSVGGGGIAGYGIYGSGVNGIYAATGSGGTAVYATGGPTGNGGYDFYAANAAGRSYFAGSVGIGTATPGAKLDILAGTQGALVYSMFLHSGYYQAGSAIGIGFGSDGNASYAKGGIVYDATGYGGWNRGDIKFLQKTSNDAVAAGLSDVVMTIKNTGNVGIGTTNPLDLLSIGAQPTTGSAIGTGHNSTATYLTADTYALANIGYVQTLTNSSNLWSGAKNGNIWNGTSGAGNVGIGTTAPGQKLDVAGNININTNGTNALFSTYKGAGSDGNNIWIGGGGQSSSGPSGYQGTSNTAIGMQALYSNTSGYQNTAIGTQALYSNTSNGNNTANGYKALYFNTSFGNTANGSNALFYNTGGYNNTANGANALNSNTTGSYNTANGVQSLYSNTTGLQNTADGSQTLRDLNITNGTGNNTALGYNTGRGIVTGINNTILGANVTGLAATLSNNIIIADGSGNRRINVDSTGNVGIGTTAPSQKLDVYSIIALNGKTAFNGGDTWLRINESSAFSSGTYFGSSIVRTDNRLEVGSGGATFGVSSGGNVNAANNVVAYGFQGNGNVGGTGAASWHPSGIYSAGNNWLYGATYHSSGSIYGDNFAIPNSGNTYFNGGNVGIGTTNPTYRLQLGTDGGLADSIRIGSYEVANNTRQYIGYARKDTGLFESAGNGDTPGTVLGGVSGIRIVNTPGTINIDKADNSVQLLTHAYGGGSQIALHANYNGNVGIGTTNPLGKLNIARTTTSGYGTADLYLNLGGLESGNMGTHLIGFGNDADSQIYSPAYMGYIEQYAAVDNTLGSLVFGTRNVQTDTKPSERMRIAENGNVGIGTTIPIANLHVQGSFRPAGGYKTPPLCPLYGGGEGAYSFTDTDANHYVHIWAGVWGRQSALALTNYTISQYNGYIGYSGLSVNESSSGDDERLYYTDCTENWNNQSATLDSVTFTNPRLSDSATPMLLMVPGGVTTVMPGYFSKAAKGDTTAAGARYLTSTAANGFCQEFNMIYSSSIISYNTVSNCETWSNGLFTFAATCGSYFISITCS